MSNDHKILSKRSNPLTNENDMTVQSATDYYNNVYYVFCRPKYFCKNCEGDIKGHYETCNTEDCPAGEESFRLKQCKERIHCTGNF